MMEVLSPLPPIGTFPLAWEGRAKQIISSCGVGIELLQLFSYLSIS